MSEQPTITMFDQFKNFGLEQNKAKDLASKCEKILSMKNFKGVVKWQQISKKLLTPQIPFEIHELLFNSCYTNPKEQKYIWYSTKDEKKSTNLTKCMEECKKDTVEEFFEWSHKNREEFWTYITTKRLNINFDTKPEQFKSFDLTKGIKEPIYYPGCKFNIADSILAGDGKRNAIVWSNANDVDPKTNKPRIHNISLSSLRETVNRIADGLTNKLKLKVGTTIGIAMPMNWESVAIYLGIIKAGMSVVSIADSFSTSEIGIRLKISNCDLIFTQDVILRGNKSLDLYNRVINTNIKQAIVLAGNLDGNVSIKLRESDISFKSFLENTSSEFNSVIVDSMHIGNILFSSGTTGEPKAIPWHHSTFVKAITDGYLHQNIQENEVICWPTNVGWMMGPWLIAQLALKTTIALFVGPSTTPGFCRFIQDTKTAFLGVIPSIVKAWMKNDTLKGINWSCVKRFSSTGEASNPRLYHWLVSRAYYKPVLEYVGGTEIAGGYLCGTMNQSQLLSSFSQVCFGMDIKVIEQNDDKEGELVIIPPSIGLSVTLLNRDHKKVYYNDENDYRKHGDHLRCLPKNYYQHLGRVDDTMNLGGIKTSSISIENVITKHPLLSKECAAISYRKEQVDSEKLIICCVPKNNQNVFKISFNQKPLGLTICPVLNTNLNRTVVYNINFKQNEKDLANYLEYLVKKPVIYKINDIVVLDYEFKDVTKLISSLNKFPIEITFLSQDFDIKNIKKELQIQIKNYLNPLFRIHDLYVIPQLPRTASGKVMRRVLRSQYSKAIA